MQPNHLPGIVLGEDTWDKEPDSFTRVVEKGRQGLYYGLSNGLNRINNYLYGTHRGKYYLIGADSGVGKTTLTDFMYVISLWLDCKAKGIPYKCVYLSFEISKVQKLARWTSTFIKLLFNVDLPSDYILGRIPGLKVTDDHLAMIKIAKQYLNEMQKDVIILEGGVHPTWVLNYMVNLYEDKTLKLGKVHRDKPKHDKDKGFIRGFEPNDPRLLVQLVCDHLALAHEEKSTSGTKAVIDKLSNYAVMLRNTFDTTIVFIQQFTTDLMSTHRMSKKGDSLFAPQRMDFGDSKYTFRDADVVMGLISPVRFDLPAYKGYDVTRLMGYLLANHIMKNRGPDSRMIPLFMNPISGIFEELPTDPVNELAMEPYYKEVQRLEATNLLFAPKLAA